MTSLVESFVQATQLLHGNFGWGSAVVFAVLVKGTVLLLFALALTLGLRRASAASRHLIWTLALGAMLALPVLALTLPAWKAPIFSSSPSVVASNRMTTEGDFAARPVNPQLVPGAAYRQPARPARTGWILLLWAIGTMFFVARMAVGGVRVRRIVGGSLPLNTNLVSSILENARRRLSISRTVELRTSSETAIPFTRGMFRPAIFLPEAAREWPRKHLEFVLTHELAHVYRHDYLTQMPAQTACALFWFHPLVWLAAARMRKERELACDDMVLSFGHQAADYAEFLLALGRNLRTLNPVWAGTVPIAQSSQLEVRMKALLDPKLNHRPLASSRVLFAAVLTVALLVPAAAIHSTATNDTADISGTVRDPSGAVIPSASVVLINMKSHEKVEIETEQDGSFKFPAIPAGSYQLEYAKPGFVRKKSSVFELAPPDDLHENITLDVGEVTQMITVTGHRPAGNAATFPHEPRRIRVGGLVEAAKLIKKTNPVYPMSAEKQGIEGTVVLRAVIGTKGQVLSLSPYNSVDPALTKAAMDAVREWQYRPTLLNGVPVEVATTIEVVFRLD